MADKTIDQIKKTLAYVTSNVNALDVLLQMEKILDESGIYAYDNWQNGEVVDGPKIERYWITIVLMYPEKEMPEPIGGMRLVKYGGKVSYQKSKFNKSERVMNRSGIEDNRTKEAKHHTENVWLITLKMPRRLIDDAIDRYLDLDNAAEQDFIEDKEQVSSAYDENVNTTDENTPEVNEPVPPMKETEASQDLDKI